MCIEEAFYNGILLYYFFILNNEYEKAANEENSRDTETDQNNCNKLSLTD